MSSFSRAAASALLAVAMLAPLAACTGIRPVYSDAGLGAKRVHVVYAAPNNRLEQIIYNDLALKLGSGGDNAPTVSVTAWSGTADLTNNTVSTPVNAKQVTVSASLTVTAPDGAVLFSGSRSQTADLTHSAQSLANRQATESAERQAALLLADTLRLEVLGALSKWPH
jgi:LPS-assembly lipoprotein